MRKKLSNIPFKTEVLIFFLPTIALSVLIVGILAYSFEARQIEDNATFFTQNTVKQTSKLINDRLTAVFLQLDAISRNTVTQNLIYNNYPAEVCTEKYNDIIAMNSLLESTYQNNNQMFDSIFFTNSRNFQLSVFTGDQLLGEKIDLNDWFKRYSNNNSGYYWLNDHIDTIFQTPRDRRVISVFKNIGGDNQKEGVLLFNLKRSYFINELSNIFVSKNSYAVIIGPDGIIKPDNVKQDYDLSDFKLTQIYTQNKNMDTLNIKSKTGEKLLFVYNRMEANRWIVAEVVPESDLFSNAKIFRQIILESILLSILIATILSYCFARYITYPIQSLYYQVRRFEEGNMDIYFKVSGSREVQVLGKGLNNLLVRVNELLYKVKSEQQQKSKMELMALQSQIKPHFLYNTLASIKQLVELNNPESAEKMCGALIQFYKIGISGGKDEITVEQELEHVRNYLLIQKMRYGDNLDFDIIIQDDILSTRILKLTVQPIVENAIYHGIKCKTGPGMIIVSARKENDLCVIEVYDDGVGIENGQLIKLNKAVHEPFMGENEVTFGLRNVNRRILLHYGEEYGLDIQSIEHVCTTVKIHIPLNYRHQSNERTEHYA